MKQKWIFIRGLAREKTHWGDFVEEFQKRNPDVEILLLDLKGNGETFRSKTPLSVQELCEDLRERSQLFRADSPVQILSVSLGAMVAIEWASKYPQEIKKLVAVNTSSSISRFYKRLQWAAIPKLLSAALARTPEKKEQAILSLVAPRALQQQPDLVAKFAQVQRVRPVQVMNFIRQLWAARSMKLARRGPQTEVILVNSLGDQMVHPDCTVDIAKHLGLAFHSHPWGGHDLPLEDAEWLISLISENKS